MKRSIHAGKRLKQRSDAREKSARTEVTVPYTHTHVHAQLSHIHSLTTQALQRLTDGSVASAQALRNKICTLLDLAGDVVWLSVAEATSHLTDFTPAATTKEIGRQVMMFMFVSLVHTL